MFKDLEKLENDLEDLEQKYFILKMQDHWDSEDYRYADWLKDKMNGIKEKIENACKKS